MNKTHCCLYRVTLSQSTSSEALEFSSHDKVIVQQHITIAKQKSSALVLFQSSVSDKCWYFWHFHPHAIGKERKHQQRSVWNLEYEQSTSKFDTFVGVECFTSLQQASNVLFNVLGCGGLQTSSLSVVVVVDDAEDAPQSNVCLQDADVRLKVSSLKTLL